MNSKRRAAHPNKNDYEHLVQEVSSDSDREHELDDIEVASSAYGHRHSHSHSSLSSSVGSLFAWRAPGHVRAPAKWLRLLRRVMPIFLVLFLAYVVLTPLVNPSYLYRPSGYSGRNERQEKVFIAANIVDEELIRGAWGDRIVQLVELLGEENVFLSIYENDSGASTKAALQELGARVKCEILYTAEKGNHSTNATTKARKPSYPATSIWTPSPPSKSSPQSTA